MRGSPGALRRPEACRAGPRIPADLGLIRLDESRKCIQPAVLRSVGDIRARSHRQRRMRWLLERVLSISREGPIRSLDVFASRVFRGCRKDRSASDGNLPASWNFAALAGEWQRLIETRRLDGERDPLSNITVFWRYFLFVRIDRIKTLRVFSDISVVIHARREAFGQIRTRKLRIPA